MSVAGLLIGLLNIAIVVAVLLLVGVLVRWVVNTIIGLALPEQASRIYLAIVALVALVMVVSLLLGLPFMRLV